MLAFAHSLYGNGPTPLMIGLAAVVAFLSVGSMAAAILPGLKGGESFKDLRPRMASWWVIVALLTGALALGWRATAVLFAAISFLALREFLSLAPARREDRLVIAVAISPSR